MTPRSLHTCPKGHETCWPEACPACRAIRIPWGMTPWTKRVKARILREKRAPVPGAIGRPPSVFYEKDGHSRTAREWAEALGCSITTIRKTFGRAEAGP